MDKEKASETENVFTYLKKQVEAGNFPNKKLKVEEKPQHPIPPRDEVCDIVQSVRELPPAHYTLKINSFSFLLQMLEKTGATSYNSEIFEAGGYNWSLSLYPNGDDKSNGTGYISIILNIEKTRALPLNWEINVNYKVLVFDQLSDKYLSFQDCKVRQFHQMKKEWGIARLLPLNVFHDSKNGYLVHDKCVFGVEIFVISYSGRGEELDLPKYIGSTYRWKVPNCSYGESVRYSEGFTLGGFIWKLAFYPRGDNREKGKSLSLFLEIVNLKTVRLYVEYKMCIKNQKGRRDVEYTNAQIFSALKPSWGRSNFIPLTDIGDVSKGFLVKDTLIVQIEILRVSTIKSYSTKN